MVGAALIHHHDTWISLEWQPTFQTPKDFLPMLWAHVIPEPADWNKSLEIPQPLASSGRKKCRSRARLGSGCWLQCNSVRIILDLIRFILRTEFLYLRTSILNQKWSSGTQLSVLTFSILTWPCSYLLGLYWTFPFIKFPIYDLLWS